MDPSIIIMFKLGRLPYVVSPVRFYATAGAATSAKAVPKGAAPVQYLKDPLSRKTYLINRYNTLLSDAQIVLFLHHNNLVKTEINTYRDQIRSFGADMTVVRNHLFKAYLRSEHESEPASVEAYKRNRSVKHSLAPLLNGPTAIVTVKENDPQVVAKILKFTNTTNEKLFIVGARIENNLFDINQIKQFKDLPTKEQLHSQLAGMLTMLSGAGLVQTLQASSQHLYLTLESHRKNNDPSEKKEEESGSEEQ